MDDFNKGTALVLEKLYEAFPQETWLNLQELDPEADANTIKNYGATIEFLEREGFLRFTNSDDEGTYFSGVVLTSKGLAVLNSIPDALQERLPLGHRIRNALKSGSKEVVTTVVNQVISTAVSGYANYLNVGQ